MTVFTTKRPTSKQQRMRRHKERRLSACPARRGRPAGGFDPAAVARDWQQFFTPKGVRAQPRYWDRPIALCFTLVDTTPGQFLARPLRKASVGSHASPLPPHGICWAVNNVFRLIEYAREMKLYFCGLLSLKPLFFIRAPIGRTQEQLSGNEKITKD